MFPSKTLLSIADNGLVMVSMLRAEVMVLRPEFFPVSSDFFYNIIDACQTHASIRMNATSLSFFSQDKGIVDEINSSMRKLCCK